MQRQSHTYAQAGTYQVTLTAGNAGGSHMAKPVSVTASLPAAPVARFSANPTLPGPAPLAVQFTNTSTGTTNTSTWCWKIGVVVHSNIYESTVRSILYLHQADGYTGTYRSNAGVSNPPATKTITVNPPTTAAPVASFTPTQATGSDPLTVNFTDTSTGDIKSWVWDFGDGSSKTTVTTAKTTVPHIYTYGTNGTYTASLTVTSSTNIQKTATGKITVNAVQPKADFSATPTSTPLQVQFSDSSTGTVNRWSWKFGDGGTSTARNPAYTYKAAGTYPVTLTATGPTGMTNTTPPKSITVSAARRPGWWPPTIWRKPAARRWSMPPAMAIMAPYPVIIPPIRPAPACGPQVISATRSPSMASMTG